VIAPLDVMAGVALALLSINVVLGTVQGITGRRLVVGQLLRVPGREMAENRLRREGRGDAVLGLGVVCLVCASLAGAGPAAGLLLGVMLALFLVSFWIRGRKP
jgi:hypothetical protein